MIRDFLVVFGTVGLLVAAFQAAEIWAAVFLLTLFVGVFV